MLAPGGLIREGGGQEPPEREIESIRGGDGRRQPTTRVVAHRIIEDRERGARCRHRGDRVSGVHRVDVAGAVTTENTRQSPRPEVCGKEFSFLNAYLMARRAGGPQGSTGGRTGGRAIGCRLVRFGLTVWAWP